MALKTDDDDLYTEQVLDGLNSILEQSACNDEGRTAMRLAWVLRNTVAVGHLSQAAQCRARQIYLERKALPCAAVEAGALSAGHMQRARYALGLDAETKGGR